VHTPRRQERGPDARSRKRDIAGAQRSLIASSTSFSQRPRCRAGRIHDSPLNPRRKKRTVTENWKSAHEVTQERFLSQAI
jgi:hypothetical protein